MSSLENFTKKQLAYKIKVTQITLPKYIGITRKKLEQLPKPELVALYKKQVAMNSAPAQSKGTNGRVRLQNLKALDRNTERLVLRQLYLKQRNALIIELGTYANSAYDKRKERRWHVSVCALKKPNVKAAYDALPWNKNENMNDHYRRIFSILFDVDSGAFCTRIIDHRYLKNLLLQLYKLKSKLTFL